MSFLARLTNGYSRRRFAFLFFSLLITMVAAPVFETLRLSTQFMEVLLGLNILAALVVTLFSFGNYVTLGLLLLLIVVRGAHALAGYQTLLVTTQGIAALICLVSICVMLRFSLLSKGSVSTERLFAALSVYLMLGVTCGVIFYIFEKQWPGSFSIHGSSLSGSRRMQMAETLYFSFVTLGTLGYGDMTPIGAAARALAVAEAIGGQMYLVVVVARLVSLYEAPGDRGDSQQG
ncbi:MAG: hypothetical protein GX443_01280 [Deltaproteobacteria bacterium]|nr:hypothetical protein [Deltaproteobacteria bacterium]